MTTWCRLCSGEGWIEIQEKWQECPVCRGRGYIDVPSPRQASKEKAWKEGKQIAFVFGASVL